MHFLSLHFITYDNAQIFWVLKRLIPMLINLGTVLISERILLILLVTKSTTSTSETDVMLLIFFLNKLYGSHT